ncbi:DUF6059 family protein [Streptomyces sp. NPDC001817]|uniref:DUF6059 family protein n=1 Tax=Streptomyces sp. NPDC001817 TaxID=3154398 RepID=UPI003319FAF6
MRFLAVRLLRSAYHALSAFGWLCLAHPAPPIDPADSTEPPAPTGPPPGHPERLCPERPLTRVELSLERRLLSRTRRWGP